jgi:hypothetical protein
MTCYGNPVSSYFLFFFLKNKEIKMSEREKREVKESSYEGRKEINEERSYRQTIKFRLNQFTLEAPQRTGL